MKASFVPEKNEPRKDGGPWPRKPLGPQLLRSASAERTPARTPQGPPRPGARFVPWEQSMGRR